MKLEKLEKIEQWKSKIVLKLTVFRGFQCTEVYSLLFSSKEFLQGFSVWQQETHLMLSFIVPVRIINGLALIHKMPKPVDKYVIQALWRLKAWNPNYHISSGLLTGHGFSKIGYPFQTEDAIEGCLSFFTMLHHNNQSHSSPM
jgi:hypothetical protein